MKKIKDDGYLMEFAIAVCPNSPELFLSTGSRNIIISATELILKLQEEIRLLKGNGEPLSKVNLYV
jgi:hypothetical protein